MIYLDYNSTTPVDERVLEIMLPYFTEKFGNASSKTHAFGWVAEEAIKNAREQVAQLINGTGSEIVFTSGATEAINLAIKGIYEAYATKGKHIITSVVEHKAVLDVCSSLEKKGATVTYLPVNNIGHIDLETLENAVQPDTILVCLMYANNETGVINPVKKIAEIVHRKNSIFMSDATQAAGKIPVDVQAAGIDLLCMSAHKMYGPKGVGSLYVRRKNPRVTLFPQIVGGGQERGLRSGTMNVPGIVGLGKACEIAVNELKEEGIKINALRNKLETALLEIPGTKVNGDTKNRLPNTCSISFKDIKADSLITKLKDIAISTGSACTSALPEPSHVLKAMGISDKNAYGSVRFSLGRFTTEKEINFTIEAVTKALK